MSHTLTIAKRELSALFYSPIAYIVLALFGLGVTYFFFQQFIPGQPAEMRYTFSWIVWLMILLTPAISMRLISEEYRAGTIELLMTSPVSDAQVILGKWFGAMGFFVVLLVPVLILAALLEMNADPDRLKIVAGLIGLLLVGGLYLSIGIFASAITENQIIAFLLTVAVIMTLTVVMRFLPMNMEMGQTWRQVIFYINVERRFEEFNKGIIDISSVLYLASGTALFLFVATMILQSKRWR